MKKVPKHIFCLNQSIHQSIINKLFEKCTTLERNVIHFAMWRVFRSDI